MFSKDTTSCLAVHTVCPNLQGFCIIMIRLNRSATCCSHHRQSLSRANPNPLRNDHSTFAISGV